MEAGTISKEEFFVRRRAGPQQGDAVKVDAGVEVADDAKGAGEATKTEEATKSEKEN